MELNEWETRFVDSIEHQLGREQQALREHLPDQASPTSPQCGPNGELVAAELNARDVVVDYRPGAGIRVAPHFYTAEDEVRLALDQISEILSTKAYERHASVGGATPT